MTFIRAVELIDDAGAPHKVHFDAEGIRVCAQDYLQALAEGDITGHTPWFKNGYNDTIGTSQETMWSFSNEYTWITSAAQLEIVSSDANDTAAGTGARTVRLDYLKSDYTESNLTFTLNGTTPVASGVGHADIWRIQSMEVLSTGTNLSPVGNLSLRTVGGGTTYGYIRAGKTKDRMAIYTVPAGKTLYITSIAFSCAGTKYLVFTTHANYSNITGTIPQRSVFFPYSEVALLNGAYTKILEMPTKLIATTDLKVSVMAEALGSLGTCTLRGWLE